MIGPIRISVVLATYNGDHYVAAQIRSLLDQLAENDEIVVSDDGSTDDTLKVVRGINDARIHILPPGTRLGYQRNFQRAIAAARGNWIFFSDQDDICLPSRITQSLRALQTHECVCGDAIVVDANLQVTAASYNELRAAKGFSARQLFVRPSAVGATMACSRAFLDRAMPFPLHVPHDHWLSVLAAAQGELAVVNKPFILYRRHSKAASLSGMATKRPLQGILIERLRLLLALVVHLACSHSSSASRTLL